MRRKFAFTLVYILTYLVTTNCIDPIIFPIQSDSNRLVIFGQITDIDEPQYVTIYRTTVYGEDKIPVTGAAIKLYTKQGQTYSYQHLIDEPGKYLLKGLSKGIPGESYSIEVVYNNTTYQSAFEKIPETVGQDSLYYNVSPESVPSKDKTKLVRILNIFAKSKLPEAKNFIRWDTEEVYFMSLTFFPNPFNKPPPDCFGFGQVDPQRVNIIGGTFTKGQITNQKLAEREIDYSFKSRHFIIVRQTSITESCFKYWKTIKTLLGNTGSPFDIAPAPIQGNIKNTQNDNEIVLGYFEASRVTTKRFFVIPAYIPAIIPPYCEYSSEKLPYEYPNVCLSCANLPNSKGVGPSWFYLNDHISSY